RNTASSVSPATNPTTSAKGMSRRAGSRSRVFKAAVWASVNNSAAAPPAMSPSIAVVMADCRVRGTFCPLPGEDETDRGARHPGQHRRSEQHREDEPERRPLIPQAQGQASPDRERE